MMNQQDLIHRWAHGLNDGKSGGAVYARDGVLYSYGPHFPIGVRAGTVNGKPAFFLNSRGYSMSTSKHKGWVGSATYHGERLWIPMDGSGLARGMYPWALADHLEREVLEGEKATLSRGPRKREAGLASIHSAVDIAKRYPVFVGAMGQKLTRKEVNRFAKIAAWSDSRLDGLAEKLAEDARKAEARMRRLAAKQRREQRELLVRWKAGENVRANFAELALRAVGEEVQTSMGAVVPIGAAKMAWKCWGRPQLVGRHVGPYAVKEATKEALIIGCHTITREVAQEFAARMGW